MAAESTNNDSQQEIDLRDPLVAASLALLWPGLGHIYQGRKVKAAIFMVCILGTFIFGWLIGGQRVVYASWRDDDKRWHYFCQVWTGLPAWPAMIQASEEGGPLGNDFMRQPNISDDLSAWQLKYNSYFELGTVFTMVAGLLNLLVIFDAAGGPMGSTPANGKKGKVQIERPKKPPDEDDPERPGVENEGNT
ncbi:MAG: hypothetical protein N2C12_04905 [Planctomycetales bacterium]